MESEWVDYAPLHALCGNLSGDELTRNSSGHTGPQSSQLTEPLCADPGVKSGIGARELISTLKQKGAGGEWMVEHSPQTLAREKK